MNETEDVTGSEQPAGLDGTGMTRRNVLRGLGVVAAAARHPAVAAMEFATLADAYPRRFMAGLGHGSPGWVRQMGLQVASPLRSLREVTGAVRQLLDGAEVTHNGDFFQLTGIGYPDADVVPILNSFDTPFPPDTHRQDQDPRPQRLAT